MPTKTQEKIFREQIWPAAKIAEASSGVPAAMTAAQCVIESGWLSKAPMNNCFGIKWTGAGPRQLLTTSEYFKTAAIREAWLRRFPGRQIIRRREDGSYVVKDWFRAYNSLSDCFTDHNIILTRGKYRTALHRYNLDKDINKYAQTIAPIYATSPQYATLLLPRLRWINLLPGLDS